jgi:uncharacterized repeat protein (TIGR01451 family)
MSSSVAVTATGADDVTDALDIMIDPSPLLRVSVAPDAGPAAPGEPFVYTVTYGNVGQTSPTDVVLTMNVPEGASFVSATDGGNESGGMVTWNLGTVGVGAAGQRQLTVQLDTELEDGDVLRTAASLDPNMSGEPTMRSSAATPVRSDVPLRLEYAVSQTALGPSNLLDVMITATNTSSVDLTDVGARLLLPNGFNRFFAPDLSCSTGCDPNEMPTWSIGTLAPGESRATAYRVRTAGSALQGEVLRSLLRASAASAGEVTAAVDVHVDPTPLFLLSPVPDPGPAVPGEPFTYTITLGNVGQTSPTDVVLTMNVPEGASFVSATDGGSENGSTVTWNLGAVGVGASRRVQLTVLPDGGLKDGHLLTSRIELRSEVATEQVVHASVVTPVRGGVPLQFGYAASQTVLGSNDILDVTVTATNTGLVDLTDVTMRLWLPPYFNRFFSPDLSCSTGCDANEAPTWAIGTLAPGESRSTLYRVRASGSAPNGGVARSMAMARATGSVQRTFAQSWAVDPTPQLRLHLDPDPSPAEAGEPFTYTLTFGNVGSTATDVVLRLPVPDGTTVISASTGGAVADGAVMWPLSPMANGSGGQYSLTVEPGVSVEDGTLLLAEAEIVPGSATEQTVWSSATTPVRSSEPLVLTYTASESDLEPGESLSYDLTLTNTGPVDLTDVVARVWLPPYINRFSSPDLSCSTGCDANEAPVWNVGVLPPGESRSTSFSPTLGNSSPRGEMLISRVQVRSTGSNEAVAEASALVGNVISPPPPVSNEPGVAEAFLLDVEAYPVPFVGTTTFALSLPDDGDVRLVVYDVLGRTVGTVVQKPMAAGRHEVQWNASRLPSGVYLYRLDTPQGVRTGSLVKVR